MNSVGQKVAELRDKYVSDLNIFALDIYLDIAFVFNFHYLWFLKVTGSENFVSVRAQSRFLRIN